MATPAEIIFIGLCSFLNIDGTHKDMPPPSVILHRDSGHTPYIAFNETQVKLSGATATSLGGDYAIVELNGEQLSINDDWSKGPTPGTDFDKVVHFSAYSGIPNPTWIRAVVPLLGKFPDKNEIAAYLELGGGTLLGKRISPVKWEFRDLKTGKPPSVQTQKPDFFARQVNYTYTATNDAIVVQARLFDGSAERKLIFTPISGGPLQIVIGNSVKNMELKDILFKEPLNPGPASHFAVFYRALDDPNATIYVPFPLAQNGEGGPDTGYCGPDNLP